MHLRSTCRYFWHDLLIQGSVIQRTVIEIAEVPRPVLLPVENTLKRQTYVGRVLSYRFYNTTICAAGGLMICTCCILVE